MELQARNQVATALAQVYLQTGGGPCVSEWMTFSEHCHWETESKNKYCRINDKQKSLTDWQSALYVSAFRSLQYGYDHDLFVTEM